ncbi:hypothetical protein ABW21_db0207746 [Orbilia brochopaga]|nr:hypothetical protein ABW21_db0207746 [Drechslerella brochopaga]
MGGRRNARREQRSLIANALLLGLQEYQNSRARSHADTTSSAHTTPRSFQEPMIEGVAYMAPHYASPIDPNPPAYEDAVGDRPVSSSSTIVDEKQQLYRLRTAEQIPPHEQAAYQPNTGLDYVPRSIPAPAIEPPQAPLYTPVSSLHDGDNGKTRRLEAKKTQKLAKAERKFKDHLAKGKDSRYEHKMARRADKMERWTEWVLRKSAERSERGRRECHGRERRARRHSE